MTTITVTIAGHTFTRTTEHTYPFATFVRGEVRFHKTFAAAKARAGKFGRVHETTAAPVAPKMGYCTVCKGEATPGFITERTATGETRVVPCYGPAHH